MSTEIILQAVIQELESPIILHEGRYRLYEKPDGGLHLTYKRDDMDELQHMEIPGPLMSLAQRASEGKISPLDMMKELFKLRHDHLCSPGCQAC
jgi:hypothetical protein